MNRARIRAGETLLNHGGAAELDIESRFRLRVPLRWTCFCDVSAEKATFIKRIGATPIDYRQHPARGNSAPETNVMPQLNPRRSLGTPDELTPFSSTGRLRQACDRHSS